MNDPGRIALPDKILALNHALRAVPHAFGGALALAYYAEPRATIDIDVNVFIPATDAEPALLPLRALGIASDASAHGTVTRDGQLRLYWDRTPVDLFFNYDPFHDAAASAVRRVPFAASTIPILSAEHLTVCKVVFDRAKDWVDIAEMRAARTPLDAAEVIRWVERIVGDSDPRYERVIAELTH